MLGSNIRYYRKAAGLTIKQFADAIGVAIGVIQHYEKDRAEPNISRLIKMCEVFSISLDQLVYRTGKPANNIEAKYARLNKRDKAIVDVILKC